MASGGHARIEFDISMASGGHATIEFDISMISGGRAGIEFDISMSRRWFEVRIDGPGARADVCRVHTISLAARRGCGAASRRIGDARRRTKSNQLSALRRGGAGT
jgi:hypothetical protein